MDAIAWEDLPALFPGFAEPKRWLPLLQRHGALIEAATPRVRVSSVLPEDVVRRQYAECLEIWRIASAASPAPLRVVDVGSGGGFPGMVIAAVAPGVEVHLVEPLKKRAALLDEIAAALGLANVCVHAVRAEDAARGALRDSADIVTARAVADLSELLEYTAPFARAGGLVALAKGSRALEEARAASVACEELKCRLERIERMRAAVSETAAVILVRKEGATPERYPRRAGMPGKRPLK
jgi:16S rRNA (guanine527-N7)-methyltransferase